MTKEEKTFLDVLSFSEGTYGIGNNGYDVLINNEPNSGNSRVIVGWTENTTIKHGLIDWYVKALDSTAAGRYNLIAETWIRLNGENKPMTKNNQDSSALKLLREKLGPNEDFKISGVDEMTIIARKIKDTWKSFGKTSPDRLYEWYKTALFKY
jgi:muramidase (phage lysozyme)